MTETGHGTRFAQTAVRIHFRTAVFNESGFSVLRLIHSAVFDVAAASLARFC